jgi:hypothetical protein
LWEDERVERRESRGGKREGEEYERVGELDEGYE